MRESKLRNKTIRLVLQIYALVLAASLLLIFIFVVRPLMEDVLERYTEQNTYILDEVDSSLDSVAEYANFIAYSEDFLDKLDAYLANPLDAVVRYALETKLYNAKTIKQEVQSVAVEVEGYDIVSSILKLKAEEENLMQSQWYEKIRDSSYSGGFSKGITVQEGGHNIRLIAYTKSYHFKNRKFTLTVFTRYNDLLGRINRYYRSNFDKQYWVTTDGTALFEEEQKEVDELCALFDKEEGWPRRNLNGVLWQDGLLNASYRSVSYIPSSYLLDRIRENIVITVSMAVVLLIGTLVIVIYAVNRITNPLHSMTEAMEGVVSDNFETKLPVDSDDEIGYLSETFNSMGEKLQEYFKQLVKKMEKEQEMKFGLLISQIDPHFVCNTLNTIKYLAMQKRTDDVQKVASALSNILRDRLRVKNFQIYDTVQQEVDTIRQYLAIQEYRYGGEIRLECQIDEDVKECRIPKNMMQPLVENALFHGLADEDDGTVKGIIRIQVRKQGDGLSMVVADNGAGISPEQVEKLLSNEYGASEQKKGHGIGIANIVERLEILYGDLAEFRIRSELEKGTEMEILIWGKSD
ncbi:MAG: histidine kinase [Eubacteriales bacterium]|nr:histidine kinase [Eubacteriales bacterium]